MKVIKERPKSVQGRKNRRAVASLLWPQMQRSIHKKGYFMNTQEKDNCFLARSMLTNHIEFLRSDESFIFDINEKRYIVQTSK